MTPHDGALAAIDEILNRGGDADEVLREVVAVLRHEYSWVGISFVEEGELVLGPAKGTQTAEPIAIPISYENQVVAELGIVAGELDPEDHAFLERVALLISPYCLVGWDGRRSLVPMSPVTCLAPARSVRAGRPATGGEAACPRSGPVEGVWGNREVPPKARADRPATGADASPERSESQKAARPPVVLETVGRRSFVPSPPSTRCSRIRAARHP